jgi:molybdenum cofactor cytidylyltransferase
MIFGLVPLAQARGGILAHNLKTAGRVIRKGALVDAAAYQLLEAAGYTEVTIARLEPGDVPEGEAATQLAQLLLNAGLRRSNNVHGRVNLFAGVSGLLRLETDKIDRLNLVDEAITLATLPDRSTVAKGDMIATLKIIPFAVSGGAMQTAETVIVQGEPVFTLKPFHNLTIGLVLTELPHLKDAALLNTIEATQARVKAHGGNMLPVLRAPHEVGPLTTSIQSLLAGKADVILISGASAVTDRQDVAPRAIIAAGGEITHFGMPVDPGNLICLGKITGRHVIILPGCARSPKLNGIDWILDRVFASEDVGPREVAGMGVGGLLKEIETRPAPRGRERETGFGAAPKTRPFVAALVLAGGLSRRTAPHNKLLSIMPNGQTMIAQTVDRVLAASAKPVIVVTGHQDAQIQAALTGRKLSFVHAPDYAEGMAASLRAGIAALSEGVGAALICLGDMPLVEPDLLERIIAAYDPTEGREIILPSYEGQRGNPVLWGQRFFNDLLQLSGDAGARQIFHHHMEFIAEIPTKTESILRDFDTPDALESLFCSD